MQRPAGASVSTSRAGAIDLPRTSQGGRSLAKTSLWEASAACFFIFILFGQNRKVQQGLGARRALLCLFLFVVHKANQALFETVRVLLIIGFQIQVLPAYLTLPVAPSSRSEIRWLVNRQSQLE